MIITSFQIVLKEENIIHTVFLVWYFVGNKAKTESQNRCYKKTRHTEFSEKWKVLTPRYTHVGVPIMG